MPSLWTRLRGGLARTRAQLTEQIENVLAGNNLTDDIVDELEEILLHADVGVDATQRIVNALQSGDHAAADDGPIAVVRAILMDILSAGDVEISTAAEGPTVILVVGVNGTGKTTTVGKLAARYGQEDKRVIVGAADTFRAAADNQLAVWADRANAEIVRGTAGADAASVAYGAVQKGMADQADIILIDTAGRLHTKKNLMEELRKVKRVIAKHDPALPQEILLVIDATTGQNALQQARVFNEAVDLTGIVLTKLDSSARGGIVIAVAQELGVPVKLIGVGESLDDLQKFDPSSYLDALFGVERD
jgi:fused signal recognition particle receptor